MLLVSVSLLFSGCDDYLSIVPKGKKSPSTLEDYRLFLENVMLLTHEGSPNANLVNENWQAPAYLTTTLMRCNYLWIEEEGARIDATQSYGYTSSYQALFYFNLIINDVPKLSRATEREAREAETLVAQAKVYRALFYFHVVNTYARQYDAATAETDNGIPYISTADDFETAVAQHTVAQVYDYILKDIEEALPLLSEDVPNFMYPTPMAAIGLRARVHLFMKNFDAALADAETVLVSHRFIYDWTAYHRTNIDPNDLGWNIQDNSANFSGLPSVGFTDAKAENLWAVGGSTNVTTNRYLARIQMPVEDTPGNEWCTRGPGRFEEGDARFLCNFWKNADYGYYTFQRVEYGNTGGIRTLEMYLIRAECNARKGDIDKAMDDLDAIRVKRIIAREYQPHKGRVTTKAEAMNLIRHERDVELMGTDMMFYDMRRFNTETEYQRTMKKTDHEGIVRTLRPDSELWVMPFPKSVTEKNPTIKQNTSI